MHYATAVPIGRGAMGEVLKAWDPRLERHVALKLLRSSDPELVARMLQEARLQAKVRHRNVAQVFEVGEVDGRPCIAMQLVEGVPFDDACRDLPLERRVQLLIAVAEAVHAAHREGLIHRDLKPGNILVERDVEGVLTPYVLDFGIAREVAVEGQTVTGQVIGTPGYLSPEQARGETTRLDRRSDVFSLGVVLYQVLTGSAPFEADSAVASLVKVLEREPVRPRHHVAALPRDLETIVLTCLEKDPDRRYPSARALAEDLQRFLDGEPIAARSIGFVERTRRRVRRHPLAWGLGTAAVAALLALGTLAIRERVTASSRAGIAQRFGQEVERIDGVLQQAYLVPLHDVRPALQRVERRLAWIEQEMKDLDSGSRAIGDYALGRGYLALGDVERARAHLERSWRSGYRDPQVAWALSLALSRLYRQGLEELAEIPTPEVRRHRRQELDRELRDPALQVLEQARGEGIHPEYVAASLAFFTGDHREALRRLQREPDPWFYESDLLAADVHADLHRQAMEAGESERAAEAFEEAAGAFARAAAVGESDPHIHDGLCGLWVQTLRSRYWGFQADLGSIRRTAADACEKALIANADLASAHLHLATIYRFEADEELDAGTRGEPLPALEKTRGHVSRALEADPGNPYAHVLLGVTYRSQGRWEMQRGRDPIPSFTRAVESYERAAELAPTFYNVHLSRAVAELHLGDYLRRHGRDGTPHFERAIVAGRRATELEPELTGGYVNLGIAYGQLALARRDRGGDSLALFDAAVAALERSIEINPEFTTAHYNLGEVLLEKGQLLLDEGEDPTATVERGLALLAEVAGEGMVYAPTHFLQLRGETLLARWEMSRGRSPGRRLEGARRQAEIGFGIDPADATGLLLAAESHLVEARWILARDGDPGPAVEEARRLVRRALEIDSEMADAHRAWGEAAYLEGERLLALGQDPRRALRQAREAAAKALEIHPGLESAVRLRETLGRVVIPPPARSPAP